jgi:hypothetical protein
MGTYAFDKANTRMLHLKLNRNTDADILAHIENVTNIQAYLKQLIRADIALHNHLNEEPPKEGEQS